MAEIARVVLPSGDLIWVRAQADGPGSADGLHAGPADVGLGERVGSAAGVLRLPGLAETARGVATSVRESFGEHAPDSLVVEFGIEIVARAGGLLSVLAELGGTAQVRVTASWGRGDTARAQPDEPEPDPR